jgi:hypothetical protein
MEDSIPCDDDPLAFGRFVVETRSQAPKTTPQGVEETKSNPKDNEKGKFPRMVDYLPLRETEFPGPQTR